jgi:DNA-binding MarR family transcriptional regulator
MARGRNGDAPGAGASDAGWLTDDEQAAWRGFLRMHSQLTSSLNRQLSSDSDLSLQDYGLLVMLEEHGGGPMRPFELGRVLGLEKSRLSHHIGRLVDRGFVDRSKCPTDQRGWLIRITDTGREALTAAAPGHVAAVRRAFIDRLTSEQLSVLRDIAAVVADGRRSDEDCDG